ncbi:MAG: dihydrofolate reductase family protein [Gammaproteobacteria bacterium]|nr:dihydrofolate reductase family protein [Gammaproteobacteria bacterium]
MLDNPDALIVSTEAHDIRGRAALLTLPGDGTGRISLVPLLEELARRECNEVLFECGPTLAGSAVAAGIVDELVVYAAPVMLGPDARALLNLPKIGKMRDRIEWIWSTFRRIGDDVRLTLVPGDRLSGE